MTENARKLQMLKPKKDNNLQLDTSVTFNTHHKTAGQQPSTAVFLF